MMPNYLSTFVRDAPLVEPHAPGEFDSILVPTKDSYALHTKPEHVGWRKFCPRCRALKAYVEWITGIVGPWQKWGTP